MSGTQSYIRNIDRQLREAMEHFYRTATPLERVFLLHNLQLAQSERDPKTCALADVASYYIAPEMPTA